jgi:O-methyltransferase involved in polyketide biosynthesis
VARLSSASQTVVLACCRAQKFGAGTRDFVAEHPGSVVLQLGCGLDSRFWRLDDGRVDWYDLVPHQDRSDMLG